MVNTNKIRGAMAEHRITQADAAQALGVTPRTFSRWMATGNFGIEDANKLIKLLHIENPSEIFFAAE